MNLYDVYIKVADGVFEPAPNPPPREWRERKGVCKRCGEKVFVKAGPERSFWTHGKGKTCVPKPNPVAEAIAAAEYAKNKGASSDGDDQLKAEFEASAAANRQDPMPPVSELPRSVPFRSLSFGRREVENRPIWVMPKKVEPPTLAVRSIKEAVSLGWVEAELVLSGAVRELKDVEGLPCPGTVGTVAIHYLTDFAKEEFERHRRYAISKYPGVSLPTFDEVSRNRKSFYWGYADYKIVEVDGKRRMLLLGVGQRPTHMFHISEGRRFWKMSDSDSRMVYRPL